MTTIDTLNLSGDVLAVVLSAVAVVFSVKMYRLVRTGVILSMVVAAAIAVVMRSIIVFDQLGLVFVDDEILRSVLSLFYVFFGIGVIGWYRAIRKAMQESNGFLSKKDKKEK